MKIGEKISWLMEKIVGLVKLVILLQIKTLSYLIGIIKRLVEVMKGAIKKIKEEIKKLRVYEAIGSFVPYRHGLRELLNYAGLGEISYLRLAGFLALFSFWLSLLGFFGALLFGVEPILAAAFLIVLFISPQGLAYLILMVIADARAKEVEAILPDALLLMSANVRAGMTVEKAIWMAARPEFGPLQREIERVGAETAGGKDILDSLHGITKRIKSTMLERSIKLISEGIKSGGELAHLLEETGNEIRSLQAMRKEVMANVLMYTMFIIFASVLGAPALFGVSLYFIQMMSDLWGAETAQALMTQPRMEGGFMKLTGPQITPDELQLFAIVCIILTTSFAALIIGAIRTGKAVDGAKLIPILLIIALIIFFITKIVITTTFGAIGGF